MSSKANDARIYKTVKDIDTAFMDCLSKGSLANFVSLWADACTQYTKTLEGEQMSDSNIHLIYSQGARINQIASDLHRVHQNVKNNTEQAIDEVRLVLAGVSLDDRSNKAFPRAQDIVYSKDCYTPCVDSPEEAVSHASYEPYRNYFLDHLFSPFPTASEKKSLVAQIPGQDTKKLHSWFANMRRRSKWNEIFRDHCDRSKKKMQDLFTLLDDPIKSQAVDEGVREKYRFMKERVSSVGRDIVSPWYEKVVKGRVVSSGSEASIDSSSSSVTDSSIDDILKTPVLTPVMAMSDTGLKDRSIEVFPLSYLSLDLTPSDFVASPFSEAMAFSKTITPSVFALPPISPLFDRIDCVLPSSPTPAPRQPAVKKQKKPTQLPPAFPPTFRLSEPSEGCFSFDDGLAVPDSRVGTDLFSIL